MLKSAAMIPLAETFAVDDDSAHRSLDSMAEAERARHAVRMQWQWAKLELDSVGNSALHALKEKEATEENNDDCGGGGEHQRPGCDAVAC